MIRYMLSDIKLPNIYNNIVNMKSLE